jgi:hypothetical protein
MKNTISLLLLAVSFLTGYAQDSQQEINVIYGDHHIYTIETPSEWFNDKEAAQKIGLTNFFYNPDEPNNGKRCYMYTNGYDKASPEENLQSFVKGDIETFQKKYPESDLERVSIGFEPPIINGQMITISNLHDRYREEVIYLETEETIIVFSFAAFNKEDYDKYVRKFDEGFIGSFTYRGNDPKPFLEWKKNNE